MKTTTIKTIKTITFLAAALLTTTQAQANEISIGEELNNVVIQSICVITPKCKVKTVAGEQANG